MTKLIKKSNEQCVFDKTCKDLESIAARAIVDNKEFEYLENAYREVQYFFDEEYSKREFKELTNLVLDDYNWLVENDVDPTIAKHNTLYEAFIYVYQADDNPGLYQKIKSGR